MSDLNQRVAVPASVMVRELEGESVLLNLESERYFGLDDVGTRFWACLTEEASPAAAYDRLRAEFDVEPDRLRHDLEALLGGLVEHGLLTLEEDAPA